MRVAHRADHRDLLRTVGNGRHRTIDAVVVPTNRPAGQLRSAVELSGRLGSLLVVLSGDDGPDPDEVAAVAAGRPGSRWRSVRVPARYEHPLLRMTTTRAVDETVNRYGLLGVKRSVGLLLGRLLGWRTVMFLDDDIVGLDPELIEHAASGLDGLAAVGLAVTDWPDNSVVCHANRLGGHGQGVFVSGSALLVDLERPVAFFPTVYNEDWLFLYDSLRSGAVGRIGCVGQTFRESPFDDPLRAWSEEFGEIVAEGLMDGLHRGAPVSGLIESAFWTGFLESRRAFVGRARARLEIRPPTAASTAALTSLAAAEDRRRDVSPSACAAFVRDWRSDLAVWHRQLDALPRLWTFGQAASFLGLSTQDQPMVVAGGRGRQ